MTPESRTPGTPAAAAAMHFSAIRTSSSDPSIGEDSLSTLQWNRLSDQRDVMIKAMVGVFTWLNGGVFALTVIAWVAGIVRPDYRIVDGHTLMALIGATVAQAGIAFIAITRFLFPGQRDDISA